MKNILCALSLCVSCSGGVSGHSSSMITERPAFIPRPMTVTLSERAPGYLVSDPAAIHPAETLDAALAESLGAEGYRIEVTPETIHITATSAAGIFYANQTLSQAIVKDELGHDAIPTMIIVDKPRFSWRGLMIDSSRHFWSTEMMKRMIDLMAMHKLNTLQWHLTDDHGWRIEIKRYPRLTAIGSIRQSSPQPCNIDCADGQPYGGFYTQQDVREIVGYAKQRFITVIPEIEMPGHCSAALAAYPEFGNSDIPATWVDMSAKARERFGYKTVPGYHPEVFCWWKGYGYTFSPCEKTFAFIDDVIGEVSALFPGSPYIHIGGDECDKGQWLLSPSVQQLMRIKNLKDGHEVQAYFIGRVEKIVNAHGKRLLGWDEIREGHLSKTATVMIWNDPHGDGGPARPILDNGNEVVMAPLRHTYFDVTQGNFPKGPAYDAWDYFNTPSTVETVYAYDPLPPNIKPDQVKQVLGCQAQLWSERFYTPAKLEYMAFPRACAFAEVAWSPQVGKDPADFMRRLTRHEKRLDQKKVNYRRSDGSPAQPSATMLP